MKVNILSDYLCSLNNDDEESLPIAVLFFSNRIFPLGSKFVMNIGFSIITKVLSEIATLDSNQIQTIYLQHGDIGALSEYAVSKKNVVSLFQPQPLTLTFLYERLKQIADTLGSGSNKNRKNILKGLLIDSSPLEAKYLIKIINGELRIGLTGGLVEIAISRCDAHFRRYFQVSIVGQAQSSAYYTNQTTYTFKLHASRCDVLCRRDNQLSTKTFDM